MLDGVLASKTYEIHVNAIFIVKVLGGITSHEMAENWKYLKNTLTKPGRDISFPIFTRKEIETKRIRKEIKTIISR